MLAHSMSSDEASWNNEVDEILADQLPVPVICQLRCVCKRWRFLRGGGQLERPNLVLPFLDNERASTATYSPTLRRWYRIPLCNNLPFPFSKARGDVFLVAADGGLFCYMVGFASPQKDVKFIMVNPMVNNTWRELPALAAKPPLVCGLHVDQPGGSYKLILAGESLTFNERHATHLFDSVSGEWNSGGDLPQEVFGIQKQCHFWNGSFHYVDCCANRVQAYDEHNGIWKKVLPVIPSFLCSPTLVECEGSITLVGPIGKEGKLEIMELDSGRREWRKREALYIEPGIEAFLHRLVPGPHHSSLLCVGRESVIYVVNAEAVVVVYDARQRRWSFAPSVPTLRHNVLEDVRVVFAFTPTFRTPI